MPRERPTKAQVRRAKKDRVVEAARGLVNGGVHRPRAGTSAYSVDSGKLERLTDAVRELDR